MTTPPGWYPDPQLPATVRWWDGIRWTGHTAPSGYAAPAATPWAAPSAGPWGVAQGPAIYYATSARRSRRWWWVCGTSALVVIVGTGALVGTFLVNQLRAILGPTVQANAYLNDLTDNNYTSAYDRLCLADQREVSPTRFAEAKAAEHPVSFTVGVADVATIEGVKTATVDYNETTSTGANDQAELTLQDTTDGWRVCHPGLAPDVWAHVPSGAQPTSPALPADLRRPAGRLGATVLGQSA